MRARKRNVRLYIIGAVFVLATFGLWARLVQIQIFSHSYYKNIAENQWRSFSEISPIRGSIFDRNGRPLALSVRSYSLSLHPLQVQDPKRVVSILSKTLGLSRRAVSTKLRSGKKFVWVKRKCFPKERDLKKLGSLAGVGVHREADRVYPYGNVAGKIVGLVGCDNNGMAGAEAAFDKELRGVPGREEILMNGEYRSSGYVRYQLKAPENGKDVFLTIDAAIQEVAEYELRRAVHANGAKGGALIVMDVKSGEILALAEWPASKKRVITTRNDSLWTIRSISCVYEPGSTFKLITAAALLEKGKVDPIENFDAEGGRADLGCAVISDPHPHDVVTFEEGFVVSSNIVLAKASQRLSPQEFYNRIRLFGFGTKTGIRFPGESPGRVASVEDWSKRTQVTIAFGQEISTTPLQMLCAYAAVANDGVLMMPRIVRGFKNGRTGKMELSEPVRVRNIVSKKTARLLKRFCRNAVESGTGAGAAVEFMEVAGKTGTAQKASKRHGYIAGKFIASFIGFTPVEDPKVACLVMLDEPDPSKRFGSDSAAPVFARVSRAITNVTPLFDDVLASESIEVDLPKEKMFKTPNFIRMDRWAALEQARRINAKVVCLGEEGQVFAQDPDPGVPMKKNDVLNLYVCAGMGEKGGESVPDLRGFPIRAAKRRAAEAGFKCLLKGSGIVRSQKPPPGGKSRKGIVLLY